MIQDFDGVYDNTYHRYEPDKGDAVLLYRKEFGVLARADKNRMEFPTAGELNLNNDEKAVYLFSVSGRRYFTLLEEGERECRGFEYTDLRMLFDTDGNNASSFAAVTGLQLQRWYKTRRYCGRCGSENVFGDSERTLVCPNCGLTEYPKISPCVIVGITDGDRIVLTKYAAGYARFALVAGFCEVGESFEATIEREVMEEVGLKVKNITYFDSQPWSYSDSILAGFFCEVDGNKEITVDGYELKEAGWYTREEIPERKDRISLTGKMMNHFKHNGIVLNKR